MAGPQLFKDKKSLDLFKNQRILLVTFEILNTYKYDTYIVKSKSEQQWHRALVRLGVSRLDPAGTGWGEVDAPADGKSPLSHVCVGENSVWALSRDRRVWFRNGIRAASSGDSESMARGTKWVEMVGELSMISVGPGDQVFGVTEEDRGIVFRTGVAGASDPSGKTWKPVTAVPVRMRNFSTSSSVSAASSTPAHPRTPPPHARREPLAERGSPSSPGLRSRGSPAAAPTDTVEGTSNSRFKVSE